MTVVTFFIEDDGSITFLDSPVTAAINLGPSVIRRASHVLPVALFKRWAFQGLRWAFGDTGRVAEATRGWKGPWRADMRPSGGPILPETYMDRQDAINAEIAYFNEHGVTL